MLYIVDEEDIDGEGVTEDGLPEPLTPSDGSATLDVDIVDVEYVLVVEEDDKIAVDEDVDLVVDKTGTGIEEIPVGEEVAARVREGAITEEGAPDDELAIVDSPVSALSTLFEDIPDITPATTPEADPIEDAQADASPEVSVPTASPGVMYHGRLRSRAKRVSPLESCSLV